MFKKAMFAMAFLLLSLGLSACADNDPQRSDAPSVVTAS